MKLSKQQLEVVIVSFAATKTFISFNYPNVIIGRYDNNNNNNQAIKLTTYKFSKDTRLQRWIGINIKLPIQFECMRIYENTRRSNVKAIRN